MKEAVQPYKIKPTNRTARLQPDSDLVGGGETVFIVQLIHVEIISIKLLYQPSLLWGASYIMGYHKM